MVEDALNNEMPRFDKTGIVHPRCDLWDGWESAQIQFIRSFEVVVYVPTVVLSMRVHADDRQRPIWTQRPRRLTDEWLLLWEMVERIHAVDEIEAGMRKWKLFGGTAD